MLEIAFCGLVGLLLIGPLFMNAIGPFIVWRTQKIPTIVQFEPLSDDAFYEHCSALVQLYDQQLRDAGFLVVGNSSMYDSQTDSYFRVYWHDTLKLAATAVDIIGANQSTLSYCELSQKYTDGCWLNVSNSNRSEAYPELPIKQSFQFPDTHDVDVLLERHKQLRSKLKGDMPSIDYRAEQGFAEMAAFLREESDTLLAKGLVKPEIDADGKRPLTLYGAFVMTWRSVWPGRVVAVAAKRRLARRWLRSG